MIACTVELDVAGLCVIVQCCKSTEQCGVLVIDFCLLWRKNQ